MGRLVDPISQEEYEKLPPVQKWIQDHPLTVMTGIITVLALLLIVSVFVYAGK